MSTDIRKGEFLRLAEEAYDRMVKEDQEVMITFDQMEDRALEVGSKLACWLLEQRLAMAVKRKAEEDACCPKCHTPLRLGPSGRSTTKSALLNVQRRSSA